MKFPFLILPSFLLLSCAQEEHHSTMTTHGHADTTATAAGAPGTMSTMMAMNDSLQALPLSGDPDVDFARIMRVHHLGAVDMMQEYLPGASDTMLMGIAERGMTSQGAEITGFEAFLGSHANASGNNPYGRDAVKMIIDMTGVHPSAANKDIAFARMMVPHHESAVHISQMYLQTGKDEGLKSMAREIIRAQQAEADQMKAWLAKAS